MKNIDWSKAFGVCQNVDKTFTDLTPIGEGTYGVVCKRINIYFIYFFHIDTLKYADKARWRNPPPNMVDTPWVALKKVRISECDQKKRKSKPIWEGLPITSVYIFLFVVLTLPLIL
jgi:hypothetical protein